MGRKKKPKTEFANGGYSVLDSAQADQGEAYDSKKRFLGFSDKSTIEFAAANDRVIEPGINTAPELSAWLLWNDATTNGSSEVMETEDGSQILTITEDIYLRAYEDATFGWSVEWLTRGDLETRYWDEEHGCYKLKYTNKPFELQ